MPRTRYKDLYPEEIDTLTPKDTLRVFGEFYSEALRLREKYRGQIKLLVGMETENIHPASLDEVKDLRSKFRLDYVVGSLHHVLEHPIDYDEMMYAACETASAEKHPGVSPTEAAFLEYFDAQYDLLDQIRPEVIGHFDLIRMYRPDHPLSPAVLKAISRNIDKIIAIDGLVEVNSRAFKKGLEHPYPLRDIMEMMINKGVKFTLSDDSHGPDDVGMHYIKLRDYLKNLGVETVYHLEVDAVGRTVNTKVSNIVSHSFWKSFA
ncbi:histidinolphosphatase [Dinochytrium kinnereticum]|nr:histidinolphosphatase [Dinochytrium kinnereticum]